eukprot:676642-Heterocapsa_arctica.AAC.1
MAEDGGPFDGGFCSVWVEKPPDVPADEMGAGECWQFGEARAEPAHGDTANECVPCDMRRWGGAV